MKILIFEFINGSGFAGLELPSSLAREGKLMLQAVLDDFSQTSEHELTVLLDSRCADSALSAHKLIWVSTEQYWLDVFKNALLFCEAALIIAPESDGILFELCALVEQAGKFLLSSPALAVKNTADKLITFDILSKHGINTIPSFNLADKEDFYAQGTVIKKRDGVGCEQCFVCETEAQFGNLLTQLDDKSAYIIQPFITGDTLSISAIFNQGTAQLVCVNRQVLSIDNLQFKLLACEVNIMVSTLAFINLIAQIAKAMPELWGYVGIDIIVDNEKLSVVEINPRLTSSYAGIYQALGINIAPLLVNLLTGAVAIMPRYQRTIYLSW